MKSKKKILLGITGGVAAYKAADLTSKLTQLDYDVNVVMTANAREFVGPAVFRSLSDNPVLDSLFVDPQIPVPHITLAEVVDIAVIAPATANIIGKIAGGIADDALSTAIIACKAPVIIVPSMNVNMWENKIVQNNVSKLKDFGYYFVDPDYGRMACGAEGKGRYPDNQKIIDKIKELLKDK